MEEGERGEEAVVAIIALQPFLVALAPETNCYDAVGVMSFWRVSTGLGGVPKRRRSIFCISFWSVSLRELPELNELNEACSPPV